MSRAQRRQGDRDLSRRIRHYTRSRGLPDTARHEAGHALAYLAAGVPFTHVEIGLNEPGADGYRIRGGVHGELRCSLFTGAVILWAGPLAEGSIYAAGIDLQKIKVLGETWLTDRHPGSPWESAKRLLAEHTEHLDALTVALLRERTLTHAQCRAAVGL